jgi:hypothetical protein
MVSPISNHTESYIPAATQSGTHQTASTKESQPPQDSVQLSAVAKAAASGDADHDGDSH